MKKFKVLITALICGLLATGCAPTTKTPVDLTLDDQKKNSYIVGDIFDDYINNGGLTVYQNYSDGSSIQLSYKNPHNFNVNIKDGATTVPHSTAFTTAGTFTVTVSTEALTANYAIVVTGDTPTPPTPVVVHPTSVSLNKTSLSLEVGDTEQLSATVLPANADNKNVTYSSSASTVASVSSTGLVTAKAKGQATITVKTNDGNKTATCNVSVTEPVSPTPEEITPAQAVEIIKGLGNAVVSDNEYYVRGVTANVEMDSNGFNGGFLGSSLKFRSVKGNGLASSVDDIEGKEVVIFGYLEYYNGNYQIPYLPANASPTGQKYNPKLTYVEPEEVEETVDVTNVSISPVQKTLNVGEDSTLSATVLPTNATNKTLTWSSDNSSVCSVTQSGEITAKAKGTATITAKSNNNISATSVITVIEETVTPVDGDEYKIEFNNFESDGQSELTASTINEQVTSGSSYISSFSNITKVYKGMKGLKFGSSKAGGSLTINFTNTIKNLDCKQIVLGVAQYGTKSATVNLSANGTQLTSGSSSNNEIVANLEPSLEAQNITISTSSRFYLSSITLVCGEVTPIPVTGISLPQTKDVSINGTAQLSVTYTPSNANTGKDVTWSSENTTIATVNQSGLVTAKAAGTTNITATCGKFTATCAVTVKTISVTGVTLSSNSIEITIDKTKQLTATIAPSNATNKNVTWSSSASTIASVSQTGLVTAKAVGTATITVKTEDGNKVATCNITVTEVQKAAWTIMIYMCGADLESESGLATGDIKEILSVSNQPDDVNILIETGGSKSWSLGSSYISNATKIDASKLSRWHVANKKLVLDETLTYESMGLSSTLQSYLEWGIETYPAEKTGVIFWNHGGAMYGCCYDEKKNDDSLLNSEMKQAFSAALASTGTDKLEFVGYDTCLTQVQDIAEFNSNYFNYMIASEESEAGEGWDYDTWIDDLYSKKPTETILKAIVDGFIQDNGGVNTTRSDQTLSFLDLNYMSQYKTAFENFASALKSQLNSKGVSKSTFANWMNTNVKAFCVDSDQDEAYYCLFDVKDMLNRISAHSTYNPGSTYTSALSSAFSNLVKYSVAQKGAGNAYGLGCIYCQSSVYSSYIKKVYTSTQTNFSNWLSFCKTYSYLA